MSHLFGAEMSHLFAVRGRDERTNERECHFPNVGSVTLRASYIVYTVPKGSNQESWIICHLNTLCA